MTEPGTSDTPIAGWPPGVVLPSEHSWPVAIRVGAVVLRPLVRRDERAWDQLRAANHAWTHEWDATLPPDARYEPMPYRAWLRRTTAQAKADSVLPWALAVDPGWPGAPTQVDRTRLIGQLTVSNILAGSARSGVIGYWIDRNHAGRGFVPAAVALACDYCWQVMRLHRIEICIRPENAPSLRVVAKLGFREEGLRPRFLHINGDWRDHRVFALNREEVPGGLLNRLLPDGRLPRLTP